MLWLPYAEGYSHREIAEVMGVGSASVHLLLFRIRKNCRSPRRWGGHMKLRDDQRRHFRETMLKRKGLCGA
jgi:DNA-directed RNA polymerase specialized sigma24 family protein